MLALTRLAERLASGTFFWREHTETTPPVVPQGCLVLRQAATSPVCSHPKQSVSQFTPSA